jgi:hypothetical protein
MIIKYLLILGIGHTAGDFYLQSQKMAEEKDKSFRGVVMHSLEYALVMAGAVIPVFDWNLLLGALGLSFSHFLIDAAKYLLLKKGKAKKSAGLFVYDQMAHIACIFAAAYFLYNAAVPAAVIPPIAHVLETFEVSKMALARWILALMLVHMPANILIQQVLKENRGSLQAESELNDNKAGRKIGTIERLIMLLFIALDQYTAMGVVLTAKSIARYDRISKDQGFAEYYLLGTLLSTACVVLCKFFILP